MTFQTVDPIGKPAEPLVADCNAIAPANEFFEFSFQHAAGSVKFRMTRDIASNFWVALDEILSANPKP